MTWPASTSVDDCYFKSEDAYEKYCDSENFFPVRDKYRELLSYRSVIVALGVTLEP